MKKMKTISEEYLIKGARAFDLSTLTVIYDCFNPGIYRYAMRLLGDECLAEDCVAETFSRFLKAIRAGQGPRDHLQAYLYRIAHNWITDCYRRTPPVQLEINETIKAGEHFQPEVCTGMASEQQQVRLALRALTPDQRQVISLRFLENWEIDEISFAMGKPAGTIRALQFRAIKSLRNILIREEMEGQYEAGE